MSDPVIWRARALRYTLIFVVLAAGLIALRYQTRGVRPELRVLNMQRADLQQQKASLELALQRVTSPARVRQWALAGGMQPFSQAGKQRASFTPLTSVSTPALTVHPSAPIEVHTAWK